MRPVLLDTNAYTAFKSGNKAIIDVIAHAEQIALSPVVLGELLGGFEAGTKIQKNRVELQHFLSVSRVQFYPITLDTPNFYSQIYASLRKRGLPIPINDLWIAAQALEHGCVVCTHDQHFKSIDGLISGATMAQLLL